MNTWLYPVDQDAWSRRPGLILKKTTSDFLVEEIPLEEGMALDPGSDQHEQHTVVWVTKQGLSTPTLLQRLAEHFKTTPSSIGHCGLKDTQAVTKQQLSLPHRLLDSFPPPKIEGLVTWQPTEQRRPPLRPGQLWGNRFTVRLLPRQATWLESRLQDQIPRGFANYFGVQRFGPDDSRWQEGAQQLQNPPPRALRRIWPSNAAISAFQALVFNQYLSRRIELGRFEQFLPGEFVTSWPAANREMTEPTKVAEQTCIWPDVVPLGPILGHKAKAASGLAGLAEEALLKRYQISRKSFAPFRAPGSYRPLRLPLPKMEIERTSVSFELPGGCYATVVLEHFFQAQLASPED